jgi:hypothetical protein
MDLAEHPGSDIPKDFVHLTIAEAGHRTQLFAAFRGNHLYRVREYAFFKVCGRPPRDLFKSERRDCASGIYD